MRPRSDHRAALVAALAVTIAWGLWRLTRPELVFGISTDDHARILAAWNLRNDGLTPGDVWGPLPTLVTGGLLWVVPWLHGLPGLVNLAWSALAVYAVVRIAGSSGAWLAAGLLGGSVWFGWLANSALAEPPYLALLTTAAWALTRATSRAAAWWAVLPAALAGACRYEAWAAIIVLPALVSALPGPTRTLVRQTAALAAFPLCWLLYHRLANGDALGFLHTATVTAAADPHLSSLARVAGDVTDATGLVLGMALGLVLAASAVVRPPTPTLRGLALLAGIEAAVIVAHLFGATGVHNGPRHHVVLLVGLAAGLGATAPRLEPRPAFTTLALCVHLALQLPRANDPPAAHAPEVERIAVAATRLLDRPGTIVVDVQDDEEVAFEALIGEPERVRYTREDGGVVRWQEATGHTASRAPPSRILAGGGVLAVITSQPNDGAVVVAEEGPYRLLVAITP